MTYMFPDTRLGQSDLWMILHDVYFPEVVNDQDKFSVRIKDICPKSMDVDEFFCNFWTDVDGCLTQYFSNQKMRDPKWDLIADERLSKLYSSLVFNSADMLLAFYALLNAAWPEISKRLRLNTKSEDSTPGKLFFCQTLVFTRAKDYTDLDRLIALVNFKTIISICEKSKNPRVKKKLKACRDDFCDMLIQQRDILKPNKIADRQFPKD